MAAKSTLEIVINGTTSGADAAFKKVGAAVQSMGKFALGAAIGGIAAIGAGLAFATKEAMEAQVVQAQLDAVLKSTGGAAGVTSEMANKLAESLSKTTRFGDEAIVSGESMLLTFTNIGKDVFPLATEAMLNMSQALGQDLQSSAMQLGKALNDPVQGMAALKRVGVAFTEEQVKMVEGMVAAGDVMGAQTFILAELEKEFGGSAVAAGQTFAGQLDILKNSLGNVAEQVGMALLPSLTGMVKDGIAPIVEKYGPMLATWLGVNLPIAIAFLADFWTNKLKPAILAVWEWMSTVLIPFLQDTVYPWLKEYVPLAIQVLSDFWTTVLWPAIQTVWNWMSTVLMPFLRDVVFPWLKEHIPQAIQVLSDFWTGVLKPAIDAVWSWMSTVLMPFLMNTVVPWLKEHIPAAIQILSDFWNNTLLPAITAVWDFVDKYLMPIWILIKDLFMIGLKLALEVLAGIWTNTLLPALTDVWDFLDKYVTPAFVWFKDNVIAPLATALGTGLKNALEWVRDKLQKLKDLFDTIKIPDWLSPGSPTPLEMGIRGITDAMSELNSIALPKFSAGMASIGAGGAGSMSSTNNYYLNANYAYQSPNTLKDDIRLLEMLYS